MVDFYCCMYLCCGSYLTWQTVECSPVDKRIKSKKAAPFPFPFLNTRVKKVVHSIHIKQGFGSQNLYGVKGRHGHQPMLPLQEQAELSPQWPYFTFTVREGGMFLPPS